MLRIRSKHIFVIMDAIFKAGVTLGGGGGGGGGNSLTLGVWGGRIFSQTKANPRKCYPSKIASYNDVAECSALWASVSELYVVCAYSQK